MDPPSFRVARFVERAISLKPAGECQGRMRLCTRAGPSIAFALPRAGRREGAHDRPEDVGCLGRGRCARCSRGCRFRRGYRLDERHLGNRRRKHRRLPRAHPGWPERGLLRLLRTGVHRARRARARSSLVGVALRAEHHVARPTAGRRDVPGIERRADVLVRRHGQGHEPAQDRPGGVPGAPVLPRLHHQELLLERGLLPRARAQRLHGVLAGLDDRKAGTEHRGAGRVQRHAHGRHRKGPVRHARPRHRRRPHLGAGLELGLPGASQGRDDWTDVERARAHQPEGRPADSGVQHERDRQRTRLGRRLGHADGIRLGDRPLGPLRRSSPPVLRSGADVLRIVQQRQLGRLHADPDLRRHVR